MNWYPQLESGAVSQLPGRKERQWRAIENRLEGGERIASNDSYGGTVTWNFEYQDLSDLEMQSLNDLFSSSKGSCGSFGIVDPFVNLIAGSEDLSRPDWQTGAMTVQAGFANPAGTQKAWRIINASAGDQDLQQTLSFPGSLVACFSAYVRSDASQVFQIRRDSIVMPQVAGATWSRVTASGTGDSGSETSTFAIRISAGQSLDLWGLQVEAQPYASKYKPSVTAQGVYPQTHFAVDELPMINTSPGRYSCTVQAISRVL